MLDMLLNGADAAVSTGELTYLHDDAACGHRSCACGAAYQTCTRYGGWLAHRPAGEGRMVRAVERRAALTQLLSGELPTETAAAYRAYATSLFAHLESETGATVIVDSSKSAKDAAGRPIALLRLAGLDVRVLHLTRNPHGTVRSYLDRGANWALEGHRPAKPLESWRPIVGWTRANGIATAIGRELGPGRYLHVRLEDILSNPRVHLARIAAFSGLDLEAVTQRALEGDQFVAGHNVGGNRARFKPQIINLTATDKTSLPFGHALGLRALGGRMSKQLGYA